MRHDLHRRPAIYFWAVTALLLIWPLAAVTVPFFTAAEDVAFAILGTIVGWPLVASVLLGPIKNHLVFDVEIDRLADERPEASDAELVAAANAYVASQCNCPNFVTNLGLPHVSDCPRFGEPRGRAPSGPCRPWVLYHADGCCPVGASRQEHSVRWKLAFGLVTIAIFAGGVAASFFFFTPA